MTLANTQLEAEIRETLNAEGALNSYELCRILNGFGKDETAKCHLTFKEKPYGQASCENRGCKYQATGCKLTRGKLWKTLMRMELLFSFKVKFFDKNKSGKKFDIFRFWAVRFSDIQSRILSRLPVEVYGKLPMEMFL